MPGLHMLEYVIKYQIAEYSLGHCLKLLTLGLYFDMTQVPFFNVQVLFIHDCDPYGACLHFLLRRMLNGIFSYMIAGSILAAIFVTSISFGGILLISSIFDMLI